MDESDKYDPPEWFQVLSGEEVEKEYDPSYVPPPIKLNPERVPEGLWHLIPLAENWGRFSDDVIRAVTVRKLSRDEFAQLEEAVGEKAELFDEWLVSRARISAPELSPEYLAFTLLRMAADRC